MAAAMSPPKQPTQKQPCLRPCLQSLQLCPPEGTERRQNQTQTSRLRVTGYNGPILQLQRGKVQNKHTTSRYSIFSVAVIPRAMGWKRTAVYLSVTFHRSVCQSGNSSCHWTAPPTDFTGPRWSVCVPMVNRRDKQTALKRGQSASESGPVL